MKTKNVFATLGLALVMGLGVFGVNAFQKDEVKGAKAATSTVYCKMQYDWWTADSAAIGLYAWKDENTKLSEWPGTRMNKVPGTQYVWSLDVDISAYPNVIFTRVNGSGDIADWGAKTADLTFPTDGKNLYTITSSSSVWGDPGVAGAWSTYVPPEYHLVGSFNSWADADDEYLLTVDAEDSNHYTISDVALSADDQLKVLDTVNNEYYGNQGDNVVVSEAGTYDIDFYVSADNNDHIVLTKQVVEPVYTVQYRSQNVTFALDDENKPEGVLHQYLASVDYAYRADELKFYRDGTQITANIGVDDVANNNLYGNVTDGFRFYHTYEYGSAKTKVYLKTYSDGGISLWAEGYSENRFYSAVRSSSSITNVTFTLDEDFVADETYIKQYKTSASVAIAALGGTDWATSNTISGDEGMSDTVSIETAGDNNAKAAFQDSAWTVHNDCNEVIYLKMKKSDLSLWLYVGGRLHTYKMTVAGNEITLGQYNSETNEYYGTFGATAGQTVTGITKDGETQDFSVKQIGNNNLTSDKKVIVGGNVTAYYNVTTGSLFLSGIEFGGYHIIKNSGTTDAAFVQMTHGEDYEGFTQYYSGSISFAVNDTLRFIDTTPASSLGVLFDITKINEYGLGDKFTVDNGVIKCVEACSASVYMKLKTDADEVYFGDVPEYLQNAIDFANSFVEDITDACEVTENDRGAAVKAAWDSKASDYAKLSDDAKEALLEGKSSSVAEIRAFATKYEAIYAKRGTTYKLTNFMNWDIASSNVTEAYSFNYNSMLIVMVVAFFSISSIALLITIKRRRYHR